MFEIIRAAASLAEDVTGLAGAGWVVLNVAVAGGGGWLGLRSAQWLSSRLRDRENDTR